MLNDMLWFFGVAISLGAGWTLGTELIYFLLTVILGDEDGDS